MSRYKTHRTNNHVSGIYKIENLINHKVYIGQSIDIHDRWISHINSKDDCYIHRAIRKYGVENFSFEILIETYDLDYWEKRLIKLFHSNDLNFGYNMTEGGESNRNLYIAEEQKLKNSQSRKLWYKSLSKDEFNTLRLHQREGFEKVRDFHKQRVKEMWTDEVKEKSSKTHKNLAKQKNYINPMKDKHLSEEEKKNKSEKNKAFWNSLSNEDKKIYSEKRKNGITKESKEKRSNSMMGEGNIAKNEKVKLKIKSNKALQRFLYYKFNIDIGWNNFIKIYKNYFDEYTQNIYNNIKEGKYGYNYNEITKTLEEFVIC